MFFSRRACASFAMVTLALDSNGELTMKRALLAAAAAAALSAAAHAEQKWTSFYVGINLGYAWSDTDVTDIDGYNAIPPAAFTWNLEGDDVLFGLNAGINYNWDSWLVGIEVEGGDLGLEGIAVQPGSPGLDTRAEIDGGGYIAASARFGYIFGKTLVFLKGGVTSVDTGVSHIDDCNIGACGFGLTSGTIGGMTQGWLYGVGVEHPISTGWTVKLEYNRFDLEDDVFVSAPAGDRIGVDTEIDVVKLGVNWQFGTPE
jgi:outer membrane immunogenic protein